VLFKSEKGIGSPGKPVNRRDKNVKTWYMTPVRFFLYFLDTMWLRIAVLRAGKSDAEVVIFDRYLYDELANLNLRNRFTRAYVRFLLKFSSKPDIAYLLDADPLQARQRKPEYPLEFIQNNRASYLALSELAGLKVIAADSVAEMKGAVMQAMLGKLSPARVVALSERHGLLSNNV
jgi:thymidylate kinase